jgi:hypothetical protein
MAEEIPTYKFLESQRLSRNRGITKDSFLVYKIKNTQVSKIQSIKEILGIRGESGRIARLAQGFKVQLQPNAR